LRRREDLARASCSAVKAGGSSTASVDKHVGIGEEAADNLPMAMLPGGSWFGFAIEAQAGLEKRWAMSLTRTQSGVRLSNYVKCRCGEGGCEKHGLSPCRFFCFFCNHAFIVLGTKSLTLLGGSCSVRYSDS